MHRWARFWILADPERAQVACLLLGGFSAVSTSLRTVSDGAIVCASEPRKRYFLNHDGRPLCSSLKLAAARRPRKAARVLGRIICFAYLSRRLASPGLARAAPALPLSSRLGGLGGRAGARARKRIAIQCDRLTAKWQNRAAAAQHLSRASSSRASGRRSSALGAARLGPRAHIFARRQAGHSVFGRPKQTTKSELLTPVSVCWLRAGRRLRRRRLCRLAWRASER